MNYGSDDYFERKLGKNKLLFNYYAPDDTVGATTHELQIFNEKGDMCRIPITQLLRKAGYKILKVIK